VERVLSIRDITGLAEILRDFFWLGGNSHIPGPLAYARGSDGVQLTYLVAVDVLMLVDANVDAIGFCICKKNCLKKEDFTSQYYKEHEVRRGGGRVPVIGARNSEPENS